MVQLGSPPESCQDETQGQLHSLCASKVAFAQAGPFPCPSGPPPSPVAPSVEHAPSTLPCQTSSEMCYRHRPDFQTSWSATQLTAGNLGEEENGRPSR
uniref:Uncharacterized protein n=1 Tax=Arundo donax TaxID=35708 RepID=A0A0A8XTZ3_ARUDO